MAELRIGLFTPAWPGTATPNGIATSVFNLATGLAGLGHRPVILTYTIDGQGPEDIPVAEVRTLPYRLSERIGGLVGRSTAVHRHIAREIAAAASRQTLDAIVMEETNGWAGYVADLTDLPVLVVLHGPWLLHQRLHPAFGARYHRARLARELQTFRHAAALISPSRDVLRQLEAGCDLGTAPRHVIPNAIAVDPDAPLAVDGDGTGTLFIGRFDRHKGGDTVIAAFGQVAAQNPRATLTFVGPDMGILTPDGRRIGLTEAMAALPDGARERITATGQRERSEIAELRQNHPIAVIASRYENFGYAVLEAMAAGQAIVATRVGGSAEILRDSETALLVPPEDPAALAAAILRLENDAALRQTLGRNARSEVLRAYAVRPVASRIADVIETVTRTRPAH